MTGMITLDPLEWKRRIGKFYSVLPFSTNARQVILIYHAVGTSPWAISKDMFQRQIQWLKSYCEIVSLQNLLTYPGNTHKIQVAITFDDGYACLYDIVLPILNEIKSVATVYVNTGWIDQKTRKASCPTNGHYPGEYFLTWEEVRALNQAGWEIGSHGVEHIDLTKQPLTVIQNELKNSKREIEDQLGKKCKHFAYTFGKHSKLVRDAVSEANYQYAVAAHHQPLSVNDNIIALPRLNIAKEYSMDDFQDIVLGKWDYLGTIHRVKRMLCL